MCRSIVLIVSRVLPLALLLGGLALKSPASSAGAAGATDGFPNSVTANADLMAPVLLGAQAIGPGQVLAAFSVPISLATATNLNNFVISNGVAGSLVISNAARDASQTNIVLTVSPLMGGTNYTLIVNRLTDLATGAHVIATNSQAVFSLATYAPKDIGNPAIAGSVSPAADGLNVSAGGSDIGGTADQFFFDYQRRAGDFDLKVRVTTLSLSDVWAKGGLMARETLETNSRFAAALATPSAIGSFFLSRATAGGTAAKAGTFPINFPYTWLRLKRAGSQFTGYASWDGDGWTALGSVSMALTNVIYVGLSACSLSATQAVSAQFMNLSDVTGGQIVPASFPREPLGPSTRRTGLVITEIMYNPPGQPGFANSTEFIELYNSNPYWEDVSGYRISGSVNYVFPSNTVMAGGSFLVVARNPSVMQTLFGLSNIQGPWLGAETNSLPAHSGTVRLRNQIDAVYLEINYSDSPPWPVGANGTGHSIVLARPSYGEADPQAWDTSDMVGGSPGQVDGWSGGPLRNVVINEFLAHSDGLQLDFIELYNHANQAVDISGCMLSDDPSTNKFVIPAGTTIPARGFATFSPPPAGQSPAPTNLPFGLNSGGETIYLRSPGGTHMLDAVKYEAQALGRSTGRAPDGAPDFYPLRSVTPGTNNSDIYVDDIVINEIMYAPISGLSDDQYVELYNKGTNTVDLGGWRFTAGIDYTFSNTVPLAPGGYLVVAKNAARLRASYPNLNVNNTLGDYQGKLSGKGERLALARPDISYTTNLQGQVQTKTLYVVVDEVTYGAGGKWGHWAHGGGSSLELTDPRSNHRLPSNWADSDETAKAPWTTLETTGAMLNGSVTPNAIEGGLLDEGECLLDNVEVIGGGSNVNLVANSTFESGLAPWVGRGNHIRSSLEASGGYQGGHAFHVRASSRCDYGPNRLYSTITVPTGTVTIRAKVRWLCGWPEFLLRLHGGWIEATGPLILPGNLGTPGAPNSRAVSNAPPAIYAVSHTPTLPDGGQPVVVTARVSDPDKISSVVLNYRMDGTPAAPYTYLTLPMMDNGSGGDAVAGDGVYSATIPQQAAGTLVAFLVCATDRLGATSLFPTNTPANAPNYYLRECLVRFGEPNPPSSFGTYRQWLTQLARNNWMNRPYLANEMIEGTFVYNSYRVVHSYGTRISGSPWHQGTVGDPNYSDYHYNIAMPPDDLLLGADSFNKVHAPGNGTFDDTTLQREQTGFWIARQLNIPWTYRRFVNMYVNGNRRRANALMEDMQIPGPELLTEYFPNDADGFLCKNQCWFEMDDAASGGMPNSANQAWCTLNKYTNTVNGVPNQHDRGRYRWNWFPRAASGSANNYTNVFALIDAAAAPAGPALTANLGAVADLDEIFRAWAVRHSLGDWDFFGSQNGQNSYTYKPTQGKWNAFMFDMNIILGNGSWDPGAYLFPTGAPGGSYTPGSPPGDQIMPKLFTHPPFRRMYLRALKDICNGPLVASNLGPIVDAKYAAFLANDLAVTDPSVIKTWLSQARSSILSTVSAEDAASFSVTGTTNITTTASMVVVSGSAPLEIATITINGQPYPITWTSAKAWAIQIPVTAGSNGFSLQGFDLRGNPVANASTRITITNPGPVPVPGPGSIVFNEIMYAPAVPDAEYVELYNTSGFIYDLSNWRINGLAYTFPAGSTIGAKGLLLLVKDPTAYLAAYSGSALIFGQYPGNLQSDGETLTLIKPGATPDQDLVVDQVRYESVLPWNTNAAGTGSSLQLIDPLQDNSRPGNWFSSGVPARWTDPISFPGATNAGWRYVQYTGTVQTNGTNFFIWMDMKGDVYVDDVRLVAGSNTTTGPNLLLNGDFEEAFGPAWMFAGTNLTNSAISTNLAHSGASSLHVVSTGSGSLGRTIMQVLPSQASNTTYTLSYWFYTSTTGNNLVLRTYPGTGLSTVTNVQPNVTPASYTPAQLIPGTNYLSPGAANLMATNLPYIPPLWLNEAQPENINSLADALGHHAPWLELYNAGTNVESLNGLYLANTYTNLTQWAFPAGATIQPGEFKVIFADGAVAESALSELHTSFALNSGSGSLALSRLYKGQPQVLDYLNYSGVPPNSSYGSWPDGQLFTRQIFYYASPGRTNDRRSAPIVVYINEWMANNTLTLADPADGKFEDWFELYNPGPSPADLSGYYLTHDLTVPFHYQIPPGYIIPPGGFLLVWADNETTQNSSNRVDLHVNFKLTKSGTSIGLFAADGTAVNTVTFGQQIADLSQGHYPDGIGPIYAKMNPTPRTPNLLPPSAASPQLGSVAMDGSASVFSFSFMGYAGTMYRIEYKDDLGATTWTLLATYAGSDSMLVVTDTLSPSGQRFYRVVVQ